VSVANTVLMTEIVIEIAAHVVPAVTIRHLAVLHRAHRHRLHKQ
jgi:hypothetical protein